MATNVHKDRKRVANTRFPGVKSLGGGRYYLRAKIKNPKNRRFQERACIIEGCPSPVEAAKRRDTWIAQQASQNAPAERTRLATFAVSWLKSKKKELRPSTFDRYTRTLDRSIVPALGDFYIDAITHNDIVGWRDDYEVAPGTVNSALRVLKTLFVAATVQLDLARNPVEHVSALPDDGGYDEDDPNSLTAPQLAVFLDAVKRLKRPWYPLFATLAFTAMRIGEATALKWEDITFPAPQQPGKIRVRRSHWKKHVASSTKTKRNRTAPLPEQLAAVLEAHKADLEQRGVPGRDEWVFPSAKGTPIMHSSARNALLRVFEGMSAEAEKAKAEGKEPPEGITQLTIHGLRRTMNNLRQTATNEITKSVTGHVTDKMLEHYSTVELGEKSAAVARVVSMIQAPIGPQDE